MYELIAADDQRPTCEGPRVSVSKNTRSPASSVFRPTSSPWRNCSFTVRGMGMPCWLKIYQTKPLQSNPDGSLPPFRNGRRAARGLFHDGVGVGGVRRRRAAAAAPGIFGGVLTPPGVGNAWDGAG